MTKLRVTVTREYEINMEDYIDIKTPEEAAALDKEMLEEGSLSYDELFGFDEGVNVKVEVIKK